VASACHALESVLAYVEQQSGVPVSTTVMLNNIIFTIYFIKKYFHD